MHLRLIDPTSSRKKDFLDMIEEFRIANEERYVYEDILMKLI